MLKLMTYRSSFGEPSGSPFCTKAMCLLQLSGLDWAPEWTDDPRKTPHRKLPVLIDGAQTIADSASITAHLEKATGRDFNEGLSMEERGQSHALIRMMEEHFYFALLRDRWLVDANWPVLRDRYFGHVPGLLRGVVSSMVRRGVRAQVDAQGSGRFTEGECARRADQDLAAVEAKLGGASWLFGDAPTLADAAIAPHLTGAMVKGAATPFSALMPARPALVDYAERARAALYPTF